MSITKFYCIDVDPSATSRWYLKAPVDPSGIEIDPRIFTRGLPVASFPCLSIPLRRKGDIVDFNFCDFDMVVVSAELNTELAALVGETIQRIPVRIDGCDRQFEILNVTDLVECVDEAASTFMKWTEADGRPDKVGQYRMFTKLRIDPHIASEHHFFRVSGWPIALIASEQVKNLFEARNILGVKFDLVT